MPTRDFRVLGRDPDMAPGRGVFLAHQLLGRGDRETAAADTEIERGIEFRVIELHEHVGPGDTEMGRAEGDEGRNVEGAHPDQIDVRVVGRETQRPALRVGEGGLGHDSGARQQRGGFLENTAFRQGDDDLVFGKAGPKFMSEVGVVGKIWTLSTGFFGDFVKGEAMGWLDVSIFAVVFYRFVCVCY